jgi:hypothetical protein
MKMLNVTPFAWNKLYRRELFTESGVKFPTIYYEDVASIPRVLAKAAESRSRTSPINTIAFGAPGSPETSG